jgi:hypothetical protein
MPQQRLGFGTYQFKVVGRPDLFDDNVVLFSPTNHLQRVPQNPLPVHMNFWLLHGQAPKNGQEVELVIAEFKFIPAP